MASGQVEVTLIALQQDVSSDIPSTKQTPASDGFLFLIPVSFVLIWSIATAVFLGLPKVTYRDKRKVKAAHKIPCCQCQFFTNNPYLRCAVRPETVLTDDAFDCSDFQPQPEKKVGSTQARR